MPDSGLKSYTIKLLLLLIIPALLIEFYSCTSPLKFPDRFTNPNLKLPQQSISYQNQMEALRVFDFEYFNNSTKNQDYDELISALKDIQYGNFENAEQRILELYFNTKNDTVRSNCQLIYYDLLFHQSKWTELLTFDSLYHGNQDDLDNILVLAKAYSISPAESINWKSESSEIDFSSSPTGCPIIPCYINGKLKYFWFDTGANYSVLSAQTADECNVRPTIREYSKAITGTSRKIDIYPASINHLKFGELEISNSPAVIVHDFDLKIKFFGSFRTTKIDGIIGWKAIQHATYKIDFVKKKLTVKKPTRTGNLNHNEVNFFWLGCPVVKITSDSGIPLLMALDLGSERTSITTNIFNKISFDKIFEQVKPQLSAGGSLYFNSNIVSRLSCLIDGKTFNFFNIGTTMHVPNIFVKIDGVIGMDLFEGASLELDLTNGKFKIIED